MKTADVELPHGYTLGQVDHLAKAAVNMAGVYASDYLDRLDAAYGAIVIALYEAPHWPTRYDLIRTGANAVSRLVESDLRTRGYRRGNGYNGAGSAPGFAVYWWDHSAAVPSPEDRIVDRIAAGQVLAPLTPVLLSAIAALAAAGDHLAATELLGVPRSTFADRLHRARVAVLRRWHEGETPCRQSVDRRVGRRVRPTHCPAGHEYTPENSYMTRGRTSPRCRCCVLDRKKSTGDAAAKGVNLRSADDVGVGKGRRVA